MPFPECHAQPYTGNKIIKDEYHSRFASCLPPFSPNHPFLLPSSRSRRLRGSDGLSDTDTTLPRVEPLLRGSDVSLLDGLLALGEDELDVAGARQVGVDL